MRKNYALHVFLSVLLIPFGGFAQKGILQKLVNKDGVVSLVTFKPDSLPEYAKSKDLLKDILELKSVHAFFTCKECLLNLSKSNTTFVLHLYLRFLSLSKIILNISKTNTLCS